MSDFSEKGFRFFPGLLDGEAVAKILQVVEDLCQRARRGELNDVFPLANLKQHRNPGIDPSTVGQEPFLLTQLPLFSEVFRQMISQPNLWEAAATVLETQEVIYHFSNITRKPARIGPNLSWHRDFPNRYMCTSDSRHFFRMLIPLEGMDLENGCTLALPQTHLVSDEVAVQEECRKDFDLTSAVPLLAGAGDALAIHSKIVHGGSENRSLRDRNLIVIQFGAKTDEYRYHAEERFTGLDRGEIQTLAKMLSP